ncbi:MAG: Lon protease family protein [Elainellaceae cyanobacterium]
MVTRELDATQLYHRCRPELFEFETTQDVEPLVQILGQPRAVEAVEFGTSINRQGYNIFALGPPGTGKRSLIRQYLETQASQKEPPDDWCYIYNFDDPSKPRSLRLPTGQGSDLRDDMDEFADEIPHALSDQFESDDYQNRRQRLEREYGKQKEKAEEEIKKRARERGLAALTTPQGLFWVPADENGEPLPPERSDEISPERDRQLKAEAEELKKELPQLIQDASRIEREKQRKLKELNQQTATAAITPMIQGLRDRYGHLSKVEAYLEAVQNDIVDNHQDLLKLGRQQEQAQPQPQQQMAQLLGRSGKAMQAQSSVLRRYHVNLLVEHDPSEGAPLVYEDNPTYPNLMGRVEQRAQMGALLTDFSLIKEGALHRANGGYLILDTQRLLTQPASWDALKRALQNEEVRIESLGQNLGLMSTVSLEPEPIPLNVKIVLMGRPWQYQILRTLDPDFAELFKVPADFETEVARGDEEQQLYARLIAAIAHQENLKPFHRDAVARVIEHSSRLVGDSKKLSIHMRSVADLLCEADYWRQKNGNGVVQTGDVQKAIDSKIYRSDRLREKIQEQIERGLLLIDTEGDRVGQVNGLAVFPFGDFFFGRPSRITARIHLGKGDVLDIEREVALGGPVHSKGVLILAGFLTGRYAQDRPFSLSASLVFEQSYSGIGGDSASSAELYSLLSAIAQVPIKQSLAVTGSINQHGRIQAIGAVNEKIEGFFDTCQQHRLTGDQGVLIPADNVQNLMLRQDVRDAVEANQFHIYPVQTVDEGIELLTGIPAGEADNEGNYPADSINGRIKFRLDEMARQRMQYMPMGDRASS